jgi:hypothetical protein
MSTMVVFIRACLFAEPRSQQSTVSGSRLWSVRRRSGSQLQNSLRCEHYVSSVDGSTSKREARISSTTDAATVCETVRYGCSPLTAPSRVFAPPDAKLNVNLTYGATNNRVVVGADNIQKLNELLTKEPSTAARR